MTFHGHRPTGAASLPRHNGIRGVRPSNLTAAFCSAEVQHAYRSFLQGDVEADHFARHTLEKVWARETAGNVHAVKRRCVSERGIPARAPSRHTHGWRAAKVAIYRGAHCPHMARKLRLSRHKPSARPRPAINRRLFSGRRLVIVPLDASGTGCPCRTVFRSSTAIHSPSPSQTLTGTATVGRRSASRTAWRYCSSFTPNRSSSKTDRSSAGLSASEG